MTVPRIFGFSAYFVRSGSMEPAIPTGSLIWVDESCSKSALAKGDVVAYWTQSGTLITHRIVKLDSQRKEVVTKGDANKNPDGSNVPFDSIAGTVCLSIPFLGFVTAFARQAPVQTGLLIICAYALLFAIPWALEALYTKAKRRTEPCKNLANPQ